MMFIDVAYYIGLPILAFIVGYQKGRRDMVRAALDDDEDDFGPVRCPPDPRIAEILEQCSKELKPLQWRKLNQSGASNERK